MNSVYKMNENQKEFDFTAIRIFFSVIAILLSVTMSNARAVTDNSTPFQPSILDKIIIDFKTQQTDSIWQPEKNKPYKKSNDNYRLNPIPNLISSPPIGSGILFLNSKLQYSALIKPAL